MSRTPSESTLLLGPPTPEELGPLFETYLLAELRAWLSYTDRSYPLFFFRTHDGVEVDVLFETTRGKFSRRALSLQPIQPSRALTRQAEALKASPANHWPLALLIK